MDVKEKIDSAIRHIWQNEIPRDYNYHYLLLEDSLKCSIYYHLRSILGDEWLKYHRIRISTEYKLRRGLRADIVIVRLLPKTERFEKHLRDGIEEVLAIVEIKYKNKGSKRPFLQDMNKLIGYVNEYKGCHLYAAFIHEQYYHSEMKSLIGLHNSVHAPLTELLGFWQSETEKLVIRIQDQFQ